MRMEDLEGDILADRFRLERMVGQGGYGAVFEAIQLSVGRRCAVKIMLPGRSTNESVEKRFRDEARATSRLTHPNSLVLYDFGVDEKTGFLFLVTEFLDGCTLHDVLEDQKTVEVRRTVSILKQVAASLQDAHSLGLVHRDIKPKNIMLVERAQTTDFVKVIDFGIAKALRGQLSRETDLTRTGMLIGTPRYMAPEQILGQEMDGRVDQYVLAVVGYRMLTGRNPFRAGAPMETAMRHVNDRVLPLRTYRPELKVTAEFEDAFLRALEKSPEYRFERVIDFVDTLEASMDERMFADEAAETPKEEKRAPVAAVADSGSAKTTQRLGEMLAARAADIGRAGPDTAPVDTNEEARTTATVVMESEISDEIFDDLTRETRLLDAGSECVDDEATAMATKELELPTSSVTRKVSTDETVDDERPSTRRKGGAVSLWMVGLASVSVLSFVGAVAVIVLAGGDGAAEGDGEALAGDDEASEMVAMPQEVATDDEEDGDDVHVAEGVEAGIDQVDEAVSGASIRAAEAARMIDEEEADEEPAPRQQRTGTVTVTMIPWGTLHVDGQKISDRTRQEVELTEGRHELTLRQRGKIRAREVVDVRGGHSKMVVLEAEFDAP